MIVKNNIFKMALLMAFELLFYLFWARPMIIRNNMSNIAIVSLITMLTFGIGIVLLLKTSNKKSQFNGDNHIIIIDIIKSICAILILLMHWGGEFLPDALKPYVAYGFHGVEIFFLVSGYTIFVSLKRNSNILQFYIKRFFRLAPLFYCSVIIGMVFFNCIRYEHVVNYSQLNWLRYFLFLETTIPIISSDGSTWTNLFATWTIPIFMFFYLIAPILFKYINSFKRSIWFLLISYLFGEKLVPYLLNIASQLFGFDFSEIIYVVPLRDMWMFVFGICLFWAIEEKCVNKYFTILCIVLFLKYWGIITHDRIIWISTGTILLASSVNYRLSNKIGLFIKELSKYSFTLYIIHPICLVIFANYKNFAINKFNYSITLFLAIFVMTYIAHNLIEVPFSKLSSHICKKIKVKYTPT